MDRPTLEQRFGAAMRYAESLFGRGFQARIWKAVGMQSSSNLSEIVKRDKGTSEKTRRAIFEKVAEIIPQFKAIDYEAFLELGECLMNGAKGEDALKSLRTLAARENPELRHVDGSPLRLAHGEAPEIAVASPASPSPALNDALPPARRIPLLGRVPAGGPAWADTAERVGEVAVGPEIPGNAWALRVSGNSMRRPDDPNTISDGDLVIFVERSNPGHGDVVVVADEFGDVMLRRLKVRPDGGWALTSDNPATPPVNPNERYRVLGVVVAAHRDLPVK